MVILMVALLYPFASAVHFWQILLFHHLTVMFFLVALGLFLQVTWSPRRRGRNVVLYGIPSLAFFWLSLDLIEHAILMPLLFAYLALYNTNGRSILLRFNKFWSFSVGFALCYCLVSLAFMVLFLRSGHPALSFLSPSHSARFGEWASVAHIPQVIVAGVVVGVNTILFFTGALLANSIGYLGYPLITVVDHALVLVAEAKHWAVGVCLVSLLGSPGLYFLRPRQDGLPDRNRGPTGFLLTVGLLWALLVYLPISTSFAYPRVVGQLFEDQPEYALLLSWHIADELAPKLRQRGLHRPSAGTSGVTLVSPAALAGMRVG